MGLALEVSSSEPYKKSEPLSARAWRELARGERMWVLDDRGDFLLPDWCDERWSKPTRSDPGGAQLSTELTQKSFPVPRLVGMLGEVLRPSPIQSVFVTGHEKWGLPPIFSARETVAGDTTNRVVADTKTAPLIRQTFHYREAAPAKNGCQHPF